MSQQGFFDRLAEYYENVAAVLRGEANAASVFPNSTDKGLSREKIYAEFLKQHAPSKCNVFFGGFLFDEDGAESRQLDVIVTTDTTPRFDLHNKDGTGKAFSPVEGTLAVVSVKSNLDKKETIDALENIASIPPTRSLEGRVNPWFRLKNYEDWPLKIVYASDGIAEDTLLGHVNGYYTTKPEIPECRRPNFIHVSGKYLIVRPNAEMRFQNRFTGVQSAFTSSEYIKVTVDSDLNAVVWTLFYLQEYAIASNQIAFSYNKLINKVVIGKQLPIPESPIVQQ